MVPDLGCVEHTVPACVPGLNSEEIIDCCAGRPIAGYSIGNGGPEVYSRWVVEGFPIVAPLRVRLEVEERDDILGCVFVSDA